MDDETKQDIALFRVAVLGALVGAELEHGDLVALCREAAERRWEWPDGTLEHLAARTIEGWYYAYQHGGFAGLMPKDRADLGSTDIRPDLASLIVRAKRERPRRSIKRIIKLLVRAKKAAPGELSKASVHRLLERHEISSVPARGPTAERRSFIHEFPGDLLVGDANVKMSEAQADGAVLLLDEADSFLRDRRGAHHSWEVTQVNELLVQVECFDGLFFCATNLFEDLDDASLRRFDLKISFSWSSPSSGNDAWPNRTSMRASLARRRISSASAAGGGGTGLGGAGARRRSGITSWVSSSMSRPSPSARHRAESRAMGVRVRLGGGALIWDTAPTRTRSSSRFSRASGDASCSRMISRGLAPSARRSSGTRSLGGMICV